MGTDSKWMQVLAGASAVGAAALVVRHLSLRSKRGECAHWAHPEHHDHRAADGHYVDPKATGVTQHIDEAVIKSRPVEDEAIFKVGDLSKFLAFKSDYKAKFVARPDVEEGELLRVTDWQLLTPPDYDRTCFHFEVDVRGTSIENDVNGSQGAALAVYATNDPEKVANFLQKAGINPLEIVNIEDLAPQEEDGMTVLTTAEKLFCQYLDIFGKPTREFLKHLVPFTTDIVEKVKLAELTLERKQEEFQQRQAKALTYADYLLEFKSLQVPLEKYLDLIPTIKQRVYSICSSSSYRPGRCQLLVVREDWQALGGETKFGLCSSFLTFIRPGAFVIGHPTHSVMQIPEDKRAHIMMAGLGTGLAPFRAFVEERKWQRDHGHKVGPMTLFFGGRYSKAEYYYRDEFEKFEADGLLECCNAWSRDQPQKVYVQHKILEKADLIWEELGKEGSTGYFFLCGSKQPEKDVFAALMSIMESKGHMTREKAHERMDALQAAGRYVTEVY